MTGQLVHIIDPAEEDFPYSGRMRFEDCNGLMNETIGRAETVAGAYRARFKAHAETVGALARSSAGPTSRTAPTSRRRPR